MFAEMQVAVGSHLFVHRPGIARNTFGLTHCCQRRQQRRKIGAQRQRVVAHARFAQLCFTHAHQRG
ncbi:hypothetical protein E05_39530 [Plautia stali symbiont]|nr:hypothetical protein E05_39530 [Plautia stali symbiont]